MAKPNLTTWADLKGKSIMVGGPKDNTVFFFRSMARPNGLQDNDYDFQFAGSSASRFAALKSGAVDATILTDPFDYQADVEGFKKVDVLVPKYINAGNYGNMTRVVHAEWAKCHQDELERYIRALLKAVDWIYDPANKQEMFNVVGPKNNMTQEAFDRLYKRDVQDARYWSTDAKDHHARRSGRAQFAHRAGQLEVAGAAAQQVLRPDVSQRRVEEHGAFIGNLDAYAPGCLDILDLRSKLLLSARRHCILVALRHRLLPAEYAPPICRLHPSQHCRRIPERQSAASSVSSPVASPTSSGDCARYASMIFAAVAHQMCSWRLM